MIERPSLHAMEIFLAVVDHGTMTAAAEIEGVAQPAISVHIRNLERFFGVPLLERHGRRVRPTPYGEVLATYTRRLLDHVDELGTALRRIEGLETGRLVIGASATVAETWLPQVLGRYSQAYPGIELEVSIGNSGRVLQDLRDRRIGLAVVGRADDAPDLVAVPVFRDVLRVFASAESAWSRRASMCMDDLLDETFVLREPGSATREVMFSCLEAVGFSPRRTIQLGSNEAVKRAVAAGLGIGILSAQTLDVDVRSGDVVLLPCDDWSCHRQFWIVQRADRMASRAELAFSGLATTGGLESLANPQPDETRSARDTIGY